MIDLIKKAVVKRNSLLEEHETLESIKAYDKYKTCYYENHTALTFTYTDEDFDEYTFINTANSKPDVIIAIRSNPSDLMKYLSVDDYTKLLNDKAISVVDNYVEQNDYIRRLNGEPDISDNYDILITELSSKPSDLNNIRVDVPIHKMSSYEIMRLRTTGLLDKARLKYPDKKYLHHIDRKVPYILSRDSDDLSIIWLEDDDINTETISTFKDWYEKSRLYFKMVLKNQIYDQYLQNYEIVSIMYILVSAMFHTMLEEGNSNYNLDVNDIDLITAVLESNGLEYIDMPEINMQRLIENMSSLQAFKGTKKVMVDIKNIFEVSNIYRYVLHKNIKVSEWDENTSPGDKYELAFYKLPVDAKNVRQYINEDNLVPYTNMIANDPNWGENGDNLYDSILEQDFNYLETKYLSVENMYELTKKVYSTSTIFSWIFNNKQLTDPTSMTSAYTVTHMRGDWIDITIFDAMIYISFLIIKIRGFDDFIPYNLPEITHIMGMDTNIDVANIDGSDYIHLFKKCFNRVQVHLGDDSIEVKEIAEKIRNANNADNIYDFMDYFLVNSNLLEALLDIIENSTDYEEYRLASELFDAITINKTTKELFTIDGVPINKYEDYIKLRNPALYSNFLFLNGEMDKTQDELKYIIELVEKRLNTEGDTDMATAMAGLSDVKQEHVKELNESLRYIVKAFKSMNTELRDFTMIFKVGDVSNRYAILDTLTPSENRVYSDPTHSHLKYMGTFDASLGNFDSLKNVARYSTYMVSKSGWIDGVEFKASSTIMINKTPGDTLKGEDFDVVDTRQFSETYHFNESYTFSSENNIKDSVIWIDINGIGGEVDE